MHRRVILRLTRAGREALVSSFLAARPHHVACKRWYRTRCPERGICTGKRHHLPTLIVSRESFIPRFAKALGETGLLPYRSWRGDWFHAR
jgi:hypothetical protein